MNEKMIISCLFHPLMKSIHRRKLFWNFFFSIFIFWNELWKEGKIMKHKRIHYRRWETIHYNSHLCIFMRKLFFFFLCGRISGGRWKNTWKFKRDTLNIEKIISLRLLLISIYFFERVKRKDDLFVFVQFYYLFQFTFLKE